MANRESFINLCRHELGHWFVAKHYDLGADFIEIHIDKNELRGSSLSFPKPDLPNKNSILDFLKNRISVLISGVVAEVHKKNVSSAHKETLYKTTAKKDIEHTQILLYIARGIQFSGKISEKNEKKQLDKIYDECWCNAEKIIDNVFAEICFMSERMADEIASSNKPSYFFEKSKLVSYINEYRKKT